MRFQLLYPEPPPPCEELIGVEIMAPGNFRVPLRRGPPCFDFLIEDAV